MVVTGLLLAAAVAMWEASKVKRLGVATGDRDGAAVPPLRDVAMGLGCTAGVARAGCALFLRRLGAEVAEVGVVGPRARLPAGCDLRRRSEARSPMRRRAAANCAARESPLAEGSTACRSRSRSKSSLRSCGRGVPVSQRRR